MTQTTANDTKRQNIPIFGGRGDTTSYKEEVNASFVATDTTQRQKTTRNDKASRFLGGRGDTTSYKEEVNASFVATDMTQTTEKDTKRQNIPISASISLTNCLNRCPKANPYLCGV